MGITYKNKKGKYLKQSKKNNRKQKSTIKRKTKRTIKRNIYGGNNNNNNNDNNSNRLKCRSKVQDRMVMVNKLKKCADDKKFCDDGQQLAMCINKEHHCSSADLPSDQKEKSQLLNMLLNLDKNKETLEGFKYNKIFDSIYNNKEYKWRYNITDFVNKRKKYKNLMYIDIDKFVEFVGQSKKDIAHLKIFERDSPELLSWLLLGLHDFIEMEGISNSFICYYFNNNGKVTIPETEIQPEDLSYNKSKKEYLRLSDGRHRMGLYHYFKTNGLLLVNSENARKCIIDNNLGRDIDLENDLPDLFKIIEDERIKKQREKGNHKRQVNNLVNEILRKNIKEEPNKIKNLLKSRDKGGYFFAVRQELRKRAK